MGCQYFFQNADLSVFKGISAMLSSEGGYHGALDHIAVQGWTDTLRSRSGEHRCICGPNFTPSWTALMATLPTACHGTLSQFHRGSGRQGRGHTRSRGKAHLTSGECPSGPHAGSRAVSREEWQVADDGGPR